jgi:hypothetical protein
MDERLLRGIARVSSVVQDGQRGAEQRLALGQHDRLERLRFTGARAEQQLAVHRLPRARPVNE